jgi:LuxR family maltose regulon positive regulatory protein
LLAAVENQPETIIAQSRRALEYLHPGNLAVRTATIWKLGIAYHLQGDRAAASQAYSEAMSISQASGNIIIYMSAAMGLGQVQESENQLHLAAETYRRILELAGDQPRPASSEAHLGLARIFYEWNDLDAAQEHGQKSLQLARPLENTDRFVPYQVFLARQKLAQGDPAGAAAMLVDAERFVRQRDFVQRVPEVAAEQVLVLLRQGDLAAAADLAEKHELPVSQARVRLARGDPSAALALLGPLRQQAEAKGWADERLKVMILQAVALHVHGEKQAAMGLLREALALGEPGGFIRTFVDQGEPMRLLILDFRLQIAEESGGQDHNLMGYLDRILAAFVSLEVMPQSKISNRPNEVRDKSPMVEPLSQRELEVLRLIAQGLSNREIGERLFLTVNTVKGHNRRIFAKLQVQRRTEAVARARQLGLL